MNSVAWRAGVTVVLLAIVGLMGLRTEQGKQAHEPMQAQVTRYLSAMRAGDPSTRQLPWCSPQPGAIGDVPVRILDVEWFGGSPLTRQDEAPGASMARVHIWAEEHYTLYLALPGTPGSACDWAVLALQEHADTRLAQMPR